MSNVSNVHDVVDFVSGKTAALTGQRLSKVSYKSTKQNGIVIPAKQAKAVSIPMITAVEVIQYQSELMGAIIGFLEVQQDAIIRNLVDSGSTEVREDQISIPEIIAFIDSESTGRLTKEKIAAWFDGSLAESLKSAFAEKLGVSNPNDDARILETIKQYREKFASLAGGKTSYAPSLAEKLQQACLLANDDDELAGKFYDRLEKMKCIPDADMLGL